MIASTAVDLLQVGCGLVIVVLAGLWFAKGPADADDAFTWLFPEASPYRLGIRLLAGLVVVIGVVLIVNGASGASS
jgi:hypothetical protein